MEELIIWPLVKLRQPERLWINHKSVDYLIKQGRLKVVPSPTSNRDMVTEESLFQEIGERYRRFGNAVGLEPGSGLCLCGCSGTTSTGKDFLSGHDQALEGIIRFFLFSGNQLETQEAIKLANRPHFNISISDLISRGF